ncbi:Glutathione reductase, chloroplastic [Sesbania bispinosa]|nr:Glutathione reductase, chloroplastic [Sesbania bispinosa]
MEMRGKALHSGTEAHGRDEMRRWCDQDGVRVAVGGGLAQGQWLDRVGREGEDGSRRRWRAQQGRHAVVA